MIYLMFLTGLIPVFLTFLVVAYFMGRVAKKRGKSPWLWGTASFFLLVVISWKQFPSLAAYIYSKSMLVAQVAKSNEPITTIAEAKKINIHSSVDGVHFDVPLTYHFRGYDRKAKGWPSVSKGQIESTERPAVDFIHIYALLPSLEPMNEENLAEFEVLGYGKKVVASLTHMRSWDYYFKNTFPRTERRPKSTEVPGMLHFYDPMARHDLYFDQINPSPNLTRITCKDQTFRPAASPACEIETYYRPAPDLIASEHIEGAIFRLEYHLPMQYLPQWREIDKGLKLKFDQFCRSAVKHSGNSELQM